MARKSGNLESSRGRKAQSFDSISAIPKSFGGQRELKDYVLDVFSNPAFKYMAGGIATALLARLATNMAEKYPELSEFIRDNIDMFEGRLDSYKQSFQESIRH